MPVAATVVLIELGPILSALGKSPADLTGEASVAFRALTTLGNGFVLTALLWGSALVFIIERRRLATALVFVLASLATLFGLIHSPLPNGAVFWPGAAGAPVAAILPLAGAYGVLAALSLLGPPARGRAKIGEGGGV